MCAGYGAVDAGHSTRGVPAPVRPASVLILTLVVIALLALGTAAFFERMFAEHRATRAHGRQLQARYLAESGMEYLRFVLSRDPNLVYESGGLFANPGMFQGVMVIDDPVAAFRGRFTVVAPGLSTEGYYGGIRYGLEDESSRLNLNTVLLADEMQEGTARHILLALPGMTESMADAILDWIDSDDQPRQMGAEHEYYSSLNPPYVPRNGPLHSVEELLLVRDVTPALVFGADLNRNALIEPTEEPFKMIDGFDNSTGALNRGWSAYLTLDSVERNVRPDGRPKININMDDLEELHSQLMEILDEEMANFVIAFRQGGTYDGEESATAASNINIDFEQPGSHRLTTVLDLIGSRTRVLEQGETSERTVVETPFSEDRGRMLSYLPRLMDNLAVNAAETIPGRLNINQAPRRLLLGIPGLGPNEVDQIIANRSVQPTADRPEQAYETWPLVQGIVQLDQMKRLMPFVTTGGSVYRAQVVGYFDDEGPAARMEVVIDASRTPPGVKRLRELVELGPGYSPEVLGVQLDDTR